MNTMRRPKITIVGTGNVGSSCPIRAAQHERGDIALVEIPESRDKTAGKALDLAECVPLDRFDTRIAGIDVFVAARGSEVVVLAAPPSRKPDMSRDVLIETNVKIVRSVSERVASEASPTSSSGAELSFRSCSWAGGSQRVPPAPPEPRLLIVTTSCVDRHEVPVRGGLSHAP
jgi:predicted dinucleotide-binding enzyme